MKILLDTTYFLPAFIVNVSVPVDCLEQIAKSHHSFFYSDFVYFECNAKASKYGCEDHNEITEELKNDRQWTELTSNHLPIWELACFFKKFHNDFIDCLHLSTAIVSNMDLFLTQDKKFKEVVDEAQQEFVDNFPYYKLVEIISYNQFIQNFGLKE